MKKELLKNKKGQIGESMQDIFGAVIVIVLLIIFLVFSRAMWHGSTVDVKKISEGQASYNQQHLSLYAWLQSSVTITYEDEEQIITIADLIRLSKVNPNYKTILDQEIKKTFGENYEIFFSGLENQAVFHIPSNETISMTVKKINEKQT